MTTSSAPQLQLNSFTYDPLQFSLDDTLASGQAFRWKRNADGWWTGVVRATVVGIRQDGDRFTWWTYPQASNDALIRDYFQLDVDLGEIVRLIEAADPAAGEAARRWSGLRVARQEPEECILSFVCSTANSVPRIAYSISVFSREYGDLVAELDGTRYYSFPSAETLARCDVDHLTRISSLGFRAANLVKVARQIVERGPGWADSLRDMPYEQAHRELVALNGIGAKIADCVCLFSLDKPEAVPVDTHVWQLAKDLYFPDWADRKTITTSAYNAVVGAFRDRFGMFAGYAQNFLFYDHFSNHWGGKSPLLK
ncbi:MAG: DNA-3-methyladenine glycosylase 2 family protein [Chloroflexota bacterium]|nr:DNA-3-methyladenine glycosylase 2 family protein [Chloroflexota bacterium]